MRLAVSVGAGACAQDPSSDPPPKSADFPPGSGWQNEGGSFFTYSWSFLLTVELLCLQSLKALIRRTFPL